MQGVCLRLPLDGTFRVHPTAPCSLQRAGAYSTGSQGRQVVVLPPVEAVVIKGCAWRIVAAPCLCECAWHTSVGSDG